MIFNLCQAFYFQIDNILHVILELNLISLSQWTLICYSTKNISILKFKNKADHCIKQSNKMTTKYPTKLFELLLDIILITRQQFSQ